MQQYIVMRYQFLCRPMHQMFLRHYIPCRLLKMSKPFRCLHTSKLLMHYLFYNCCLYNLHLWNKYKYYLFYIRQLDMMRKLLMCTQLLHCRNLC